MINIASVVHGPEVGDAVRVVDHPDNEPSSNAKVVEQLAVAATPLTDAEKERLNALEATIKTGLDSFLEVGRALDQINHDRLYREESGTFEDYCRSKWGISRQYGYRLIKAAECYDILESELPQGTPLPTNESQLRTIVEGVEPGAYAEAWKQVAADNQGAPITAEAVEKVVKVSNGKSNHKKTTARKRALAAMLKKLAPVVVKVEETLKNEHSTAEDLKEALEFVLKELNTLRGGRTTA